MPDWLAGLLLISGALCVLAGVYILFGWPYVLLVGGVAMFVAGARA